MNRDMHRRQFIQLLLIAAGMAPLVNLTGCGIEVNGILPDVLAWRQKRRGDGWYQIPRKYNSDPNVYKKEMVFYLLDKLYAANPALAQEIGKLDVFRFGNFQIKDVEILKDVVEYYLHTTYAKAKTAFQFFLADAQKTSASVVGSHMMFTTYLQRFLYAIEDRKYPACNPGTKFAAPSSYIMDDIINEFWDFKTNAKWREDIYSVAEQFSSPRDVYRYMIWNIIYYPDFDGDYLQSIQETHHLRRGDCEDQALYAGFFLERIGENTILLTVKYLTALEVGSGVERNLSWGHTTALFRRENGYFILENGTTPRAGRIRGILGPFASLVEVANFMTLNLGLERFEAFSVHNPEAYKKFWSQETF